MPCGVLTPEMIDRLQSLVIGRTVWDLGAGDLGYAHLFLDLGAKNIIAVDKEPIPATLCRGRPITIIGKYFADIEPPKASIDVAFLGWPVNQRTEGLIPILEKAETIIYLGSNCKGNACGGPDLWAYLQHREIKAYVPHPRNSLIIYGKSLFPEERRPLVGEEIGALCDVVLGFQEAEDRTGDQS